MTLLVLSTASPGVEQGALQAAIDLGLTIGGWRCAGAALPAVFTTQLRETSSADLGMARRLCVQDSDAVLVLTENLAPVGVGAFVDRIAEQMGKGFLSVVLADEAPEVPEGVRAEVVAWLRDEQIGRLYVTGDGDQERARQVVRWMLESVAVDEIEHVVAAMDVAGAIADQTGAP